MKRLISWLISFILALTAGFWLNYHSVLEDTWVGDQLVTISELIPVPESWTSDDDPSSPPPTTDGTDSPPSSEEEIFEEAVERFIFEEVNRLRSDQDLKTLAHNPILQRAARKRAIESSVSFSHTRPNGKDPFTVLEEDGTVYPYTFVGENLAMATLRGNAEHMAHILFEGWMESADHYAAMIEPEFSEIGVGAYVTDDAVYATQMFGTQYHY